MEAGAELEQRGDAAAACAIVPRGRAHDAGDALEQRRLARAVVAEQARASRPGRPANVDVAQRPELLVGRLAEVDDALLERVGTGSWYSRKCFETCSISIAGRPSGQISSAKLSSSRPKSHRANEEQRDGRRPGRCRGCGRYHHCDALRDGEHVGLRRRARHRRLVVDRPLERDHDRASCGLSSSDPSAGRAGLATWRVGGRRSASSRTTRAGASSSRCWVSRRYTLIAASSDAERRDEHEQRRAARPAGAAGTPTPAAYRNTMSAGDQHHASAGRSGRARRRSTRAAGSRAGTTPC